MSLRRVAVVGAGITKFVRRAKDTAPELAYHATKMALDSCEMTLPQIDCVVH
jgi:acetyl-CoA C-acetyltransferase